MATPKKPNTTKHDVASMGLTFESGNTADYPIAYVDNTWDVVTNAAGDASLKTLLGSAGQYDQHTINVALAAQGASAADIEYDYDTTESVFDDTTNKGIPSVNTYVKVPSYYYTTFDNTEDVGGVITPIDPPAQSLTIPITDCGNCPIVQVVQDGHVVLCDVDINIGTGVITISWGDTITVNTSHPLYISVIG